MNEENKKQENEVKEVVKTLDFMKSAEITKIIAGDYKKLSFVIKNGKFDHYDKNDKLITNDIISVNPNMLFECDVEGDEETMQFIEVVKILAVSRQVKRYIMAAFFTNAVVDIVKVEAKEGEIDNETGRVYSSNEFSYRFSKIVVKALNPIMKTMIMKDIQNQSVLEPKPTTATPNIFNMNQNVVL